MFIDTAMTENASRESDLRELAQGLPGLHKLWLHCNTVVKCAGLDTPTIASLFEHHSRRSSRLDCRPWRPCLGCCTDRRGNKSFARPLVLASLLLLLLFPFWF
jgi:hypothetical protein